MVAGSRHSPSYGADMDRFVREHAIFAVVILVLPVWTELLAIATLVAQSVVSASLSERSAALSRQSIPFQRRLKVDIADSDPALPNQVLLEH